MEEANDIEELDFSSLMENLENDPDLKALQEQISLINKKEVERKREDSVDIEERMKQKIEQEMQQPLDLSESFRMSFYSFEQNPLKLIIENDLEYEETKGTEGEKYPTKKENDEINTVENQWRKYIDDFPQVEDNIVLADKILDRRSPDEQSVLRKICNSHPIFSRKQIWPPKKQHLSQNYKLLLMDLILLKFNFHKYLVLDAEITRCLRKAKQLPREKQLLQRGECHFLLGLYDITEKNCCELLKLIPHDPEVVFLQGLLEFYSYRENNLKPFERRFKLLRAQKSLLQSLKTKYSKIFLVLNQIGIKK